MLICVLSKAYFIHKCVWIMWIIIFLSTECVKNFPVDEMEDSLWITGNLMLIKLWIEGWKNRNV